MLVLILCACDEFPTAEFSTSCFRRVFLDSQKTDHRSFRLSVAIQEYFFLQIQFKNIENYYFPLNCDAHFAPHKIFPRYPHVPQIQTFDPALTCISMILCPCSSVKVAPARLADTDLWLLLPASLATSGRLEPTGFLLASPSWAS